MKQLAIISREQTSSNTAIRDPIFRRRYMVPFLLACVILFCNTATRVNSIISYNTGILLQSGLSDLSAHWGYVIFTAVNSAVGMALADRKGRRFLLILGTTGVIASLATVGILFLRTERSNLECRTAVQAPVSPQHNLSLIINWAEASRPLQASGHSD